MCIRDRDNPLARLSLKKREKRAVLFNFLGVKSLNAESLLTRVDDLKYLKNLINSNYKDDPLKFNLGNSAPKPVQNWSSDWTKEEDEKLLIGVFKYGYGSWTQIRDCLLYTSRCV